MKRLEIWFPALMIAICIALGVVSAVRGSWLNLATFSLLGATSGMQLCREIKNRF